MTGLLLLGPPAAGKDAITDVLSRREARFALLPKVKSGGGRSAGYRMVTSAELERLRDARRIVMESERYGNVYAVDSAVLCDMTEAGLWPVVHFGRLADLRRFLANAPGRWLSALLWCDRDECERRSLQRGDADTADRMRVWDTTRAELLTDPWTDSTFHLGLRSDLTPAREAADRINERFRYGPAQLCPVRGLLSDGGPWNS